MKELLNFTSGSAGPSYNEEIQNAAFFLRLGLLCSPIRHENVAFWKRSSNGRNLKALASILLWTEKKSKIAIQTR